jgi:hypothetical protein
MPHTPTSSFRRATPLALALLLPLPAPVAAQAHAHSDDLAAPAAAEMPEAAGPHLLLTPRRAPQPGDSARAAALVVTLRDALEKYRDVRNAEADGFRMVAPKLRRQRVYHYTDRRAAAVARVRFDPARPTSLLYRPRPDGTVELVGAMYTAPRWASLDDLDRRVPLSIARWHQHTNLCVPPRGEEERALERRGGRPVFGPASPIATREACEAVGGRFRERALGWMVHVNAFLGEDHASIWGESHRHGAGSAAAP